jgi:uncharacterized membrane protein
LKSGFPGRKGLTVGAAVRYSVRVASYRREVFVSSARSVVDRFGGASKSDATTIDCDRRFEIDKTTLKVIRAIITGSRCDFSR